jgi:hypothetical protein
MRTRTRGCRKCLIRCRLFRQCRHTRWLHIRWRSRWSWRVIMLRRIRIIDSRKLPRYLKSEVPTSKEDVLYVGMQVEGSLEVITGQCSRGLQLDTNYPISSWATNKSVGTTNSVIKSRGETSAQLRWRRYIQDGANRVRLGKERTQSCTSLGL